MHVYSVFLYLNYERMNYSEVCLYYANLQLWMDEKVTEEFLYIKQHYTKFTASTNKNTNLY